MRTTLLTSSDFVSTLSNWVHHPRKTVSVFWEAWLAVGTENLATSRRWLLPELATLQEEGAPRPGPAEAARYLEAVVKRSELPADTVATMAHATCELLRLELSAQREVQLAGLGTFRVISRKAMLSPGDGEVTTRWTPPVNLLAFSPDQPLRERLEGKFLSATPLPPFDASLASMKTGTIMMLLRNQDFFSALLQYHFVKNGWEVIIILQAANAEKIIGEHRLHLVLAEAELPDFQELALLLKTRGPHYLLPLLVLYPNNHSPEQVDRFTIVGEETLVQPFEIGKLLGLSETMVNHYQEAGALFSHELSCRFPSDEKSGKEAREFFGKLWERIRLSEEAKVALNAALSEAILNACQHGNRFSPDRAVDIHYLLDPKRITLTVTDRGQGFVASDFIKRALEQSATEAARERHAQGQIGGLGIMLMLRCVDKLEYNEAGNAVTLTKFLDG